ncbi:MAG TPA: flagellar biosynthetic protein FliQ [Polyangiaceae bacterium]|nr:flagellar biosynthetic protein FliQ [Polyangiaceae bacterium]
MPVRDLTALAEQALLLSVAVSIPVIALAALASLVVSLLQSVTQISDTTIAHLPRLLVVSVVLVASGPWMGAQIVAFAIRALSGGS